MRIDSAPSREGHGAGLAAAGRTRRFPSRATPSSRPRRAGRARGRYRGRGAGENRRRPARRPADWFRAAQNRGDAAAAAAAVAVAMVSRCSAPGSPTKARRSIRPGAITSPPQSMMRACEGRFCGVMSGPRSRMAPSMISTPPASPLNGLAIDQAGMDERQRLARDRGRGGDFHGAASRRAIHLVAVPHPGRRFTAAGGARSAVRQMLRQRLQHRHAHGDAHLDLFADEALRRRRRRRNRSRRPGSSGRDASPARRAWHSASFSSSRPKKRKYSRGEGIKAALHAFALQAQHHHDVGVAAGPSRMSREDLDAHALDAGRQQRRGADHAHPRAERESSMNVGAGDARMQDIAADRDRQPLDAALVAADGQGVEQGLGRMLMRAVAGVDDRAVDLSRQQMRRRRPAAWRTTMMSGRMALRVDRRVDQRLALLDAEVATDMFMTSAPSRLPASSKEDLRAGRGLEEKIDLRAAAQGRALLFDLTRDFDRLLRQIEQDGMSCARKPLDPEQMPVRELNSGASGA